MNSNRITVFCASSKQVDQCYLDAAETLAKTIVEHQMISIYGGGAVGLMGCFADKVLELGGKIEGVIPRFMMKVEWNHPKVKKMSITRDLQSRKKKMIRKTGAVVALPGGTGTLEELVEVISLKKLGKFSVPIIIINTNNFYSPLIQQFRKMAEERFIRNEHLKLWSVIDQPEDLIQAIQTEEPVEPDILNRAQL